MADQDPASAPAKGGRFPWVMAALFAGLSAGLLGSPWLESAVRGVLPASLQSPMHDSAAELAALKVRVAAIEEHPTTAMPADISARLATLEAARQVGAASAAAVASDLEPLNQRVDRIDTRLTGAELAAHTATTAAALIPGLQAQVQTNTNMTNDQITHMRLLASLGPLRRLLENGQPLGVYYGVVSDALGGNLSEVAALRQVQSGGPTLGWLQQQLATMSVHGVPAPGPTSAASWFDTTLANLANLVQVKHPQLPAQQTASGNLVAMALQRTRSGDVAGAITLIRTLPATAQGRAAPWLAAADKYVAARSALTAIENQVFERTAHQGTVPAPSHTE